MSQHVYEPGCNRLSVYIDLAMGDQIARRANVHYASPIHGDLPGKRGITRSVVDHAATQNDVVSGRRIGVAASDMLANVAMKTANVAFRNILLTTLNDIAVQFTEDAESF